MARLMIVLLVVSACAALVFGAVGNLRRRAPAPHEIVARTGNGTMQRTSFVLLVALIFYVSIWGAA